MALLLPTRTSGVLKRLGELDGSRTLDHRNHTSFAHWTLHLARKFFAASFGLV